MAQWDRNLPAMQETLGLYPWIGKLPWRRKWQPTLVFLPENAQRRLAGCSPRGYKESESTEHAYIHTYTGRGYSLNPAVDMVGWEHQEIIAMAT